MANYFNQHLTRMESMVVIPKSDLQKGMIIRNKYQTIDDGLKEYFFLILNPLYSGDGKVHALSLNEFSILQFMRIAKQTNIRIIPKYKKRALAIPKLVMEQSSYRFYMGSILGGGREIKKFYNNSYRTLFPEQMKLSFLIDYKFDRDIKLITS